MKRRQIGMIAAMVFFFGLAVGLSGQAEARRGMGAGSGGAAAIPAKLPTPQNAEWLKTLGQVYALERLSIVQYEADAAKYGFYGPYRRTIAQEHSHKELLDRLYAAYGLTPPAEPVQAKPTATAAEAFKVAADLEAGLIPLYTTLAAGAPDPTATWIINHVLRQTRMHYGKFLRLADRMRATQP